MQCLVSLSQCSSCPNCTRCGRGALQVSHMLQTRQVSQMFEACQVSCWSPALRSTCARGARVPSDASKRAKCAKCSKHAKCHAGPQCYILLALGVQKSQVTQASRRSEWPECASSDFESNLGFYLIACTGVLVKCAVDSPFPCTVTGYC